MKFRLNETYSFKIKNYSFGDLTGDELKILFRDGRFASPFLELQLTKWFEELTHIPGNKGHDHVDKQGRLYDAKNFTKNGLRFQPSAMLGAGRKFVAEVAHKKAAGLIYICCDIVAFPEIRVKFLEGKHLIADYPKCEIRPKERESFYA